MENSVQKVNDVKKEKKLCIKCNKYYTKKQWNVCSDCYHNTLNYKYECYCGHTMYSNDILYSCNSVICEEAYYENSGTYPMMVFKRCNDANGEVYWEYVETYD